MDQSNCNCPIMGLCGIRCANDAIIRKRQPISNVDVIAQGMNGSDVFGNVGLSTPEWRTLQNLLHIVLSIHVKDYCVGFPPHPTTVLRALAGLEGQLNISDNIVHSRNQEEHNGRLENVVKIETFCWNNTVCKQHKLHRRQRWTQEASYSRITKLLWSVYPWIGNCICSPSAGVKCWPGDKFRILDLDLWRFSNVRLLNDQQEENLEIT